MSKLLSVAAYLKAILVAFSFAFAGGYMLPIIVIAALFSLAQPGAKPIGQTALQAPAAGSPSRERSCRFRMHATKALVI
jgi:hypothetical protein